MSTSIARAFALVSAMVFALACGPAPAPALVLGGPTPPALTVASSPAEPRESEPEEPFVDDGDPGPVPIRASDPWWGKRDAPVTIVEVAEFQCPFCARAEVTLAALRRMYGRDKLRIVWKHMPLSFHPHAMPAAIVSTLLFERFGNRAFWEAHETFFADQKDLAANVDRYAARLGLSADDLADMAKGREGDRIKAETEEWNKLGATGTPTFLINGVQLTGSQPIEKFTAIIDEQLAKATALLARGVPRARVYAELSKAQWSAKPAAKASPDTKDDGTAHLVPIGKSPVRGKATALVTIVGFEDFQCPFCARAAPTIEQILAKYGADVRFVLKHNPLAFHARAMPAALFAMEARAQKGDAGFWKAHDLLFKSECIGDPKATTQADCEASPNNKWMTYQRHLEQSDLLDYARALKLDAGRVDAAINGKAHVAAILADQDLADDVGATGTPCFFINGRRLSGAQPFEKFAAMIDEELAKARDLVKSGVRPAQVYDRIMASAKAPPALPTKKIAPPTRENPSRGPANAKVVVQYFGDLQCPFCARVHATMEELEKAFPGKIRIVWRNLPLAFHKDALPAAEAAMEAYRQKGSAGFWSMVDALYANQASTGLDRQALDGYAAKLGLDPVRFADAIDQRRHQAVIDADMNEAMQAGISGTPAFVINDVFVSGAQPLGKFKKAVQRALAGK